jgi:mercuric ion transport protein
MQNARLLKIGIVGSIIAAICCYTPILLVALGFLGLSSLAGLLDYILLPVLALFFLITGYALWKHQRQK